MAQILIALIAAMIPAIMIALARRQRRRVFQPSHLSPVSQQHLDLFQGGKLSESSLEATKSTFRRMLKAGEAKRVEASLCPGTSYAVQVRALAEIGSEAAGRILERQLERRLSPDPLEQAWYWLDLANGLRAMNRKRSLPRLLECAVAADVPLAHFLAAETTCFSGFRRRLERGDERALIVLQRALVGLRFGVQPEVFAAAGYGELIDVVWQTQRHCVAPRAVLVFSAALRWLRRCPHAVRLIRDDERESFDNQVERLEALADSLRNYLAEARGSLLLQLRQSGAPVATLQALIELRADAASELIPQLEAGRIGWSPEAVEALGISMSPDAGRLLLRQARKRLKRGGWRQLLSWCGNRGQNSDPLVPKLLSALAGHRGEEIEAMLIDAAEMQDTEIRRAALASLGCRDSLSADALAVLQASRGDQDPEVAITAEAALARLGEFRALQRFRQRLAAEEPDRVHSSIEWIARMRLVLLWPDLDQLAESDNDDVAFHACEALEQLREQMPID